MRKHEPGKANDIYISFRPREPGQLRQTRRLQHRLTTRESDASHLRVRKEFIDKFFGSNQPRRADGDPVWSNTTRAVKRTTLHPYHGTFPWPQRVGRGAGCGNV